MDTCSHSGIGPSIVFLSVQTLLREQILWLPLDVYLFCHIENHSQGSFSSLSFHTDGFSDSVGSFLGFKGPHPVVLGADSLCTQGLLLSENS